MKVKLEIPSNTLALTVTLLTQDGIYDIKMIPTAITSEELKKGDCLCEKTYGERK